MPIAPDRRSGLTQAGRALLRLLRHPAEALVKLRAIAVAGGRTDGTMLGLAAAVGILTGLLAVALITLIALITSLTWGNGPSRLHLLLIPALGGLAVGIILRRTPGSGGGGVTEVMRAIAIQSGRLRGSTVLGKTVATATALGTGAAGGREGPIVQIGGTVGSALGGLLSLDEERTRTLIAAGAASGIAASFNAPLGGMLFAMEVIIGGFKVRSLQVVVVASVLASVVSRQFVGEDLIYAVNEAYELHDPRELVLYVVLGIAAVAVGKALLEATSAVRDRFESSNLPAWLRPAVGGLMLGFVCIGFPEVLGTGDGLPEVPGLSPQLSTEPVLGFIEGRPSGGWLAVGFLLILLVAKLVATAISLGSGMPVGSFAPSLFCGAALGGAVGHAASILVPAGEIEPGAYALVGMAAVFGATAKAPLTGILIVFELTSDYGLVLPLMLATGLATFVADRLWSDSIYTRPLDREGIIYAEPDDIDVMQTVTVGEVMTTDPGTIPAVTNLLDLAEVFNVTGHHGLAVLGDDGRLVGIVTIQDLRDRSGDGDPSERTAGDICTRRPATVTPEDPVFRAVRRMAALNVGRIPVVADDDRGKLVGMVRRPDLVKAYQRAITRKLGVQQRHDRSRLRALADATFTEVRVLEGAAADGLPVHQVTWPERTVLTSVRRGDEVLLPDGSTVLEAGDEVVFLAAPDAVEQVRALLTAAAETVEG